LQGGAALAGAGGVAAGYGFWEASQIRIRRQTLVLPVLPRAFQGTTIAILTDFHHGPYVGLGFIRRAVAVAQELRADAYSLLGDFAHKGTHTAEQLPECLAAAARLEAPLGVFAVPGNHDMQEGGRIYREAVAGTKVVDVTNRSIRLNLDGEEMWIAGVDDHWWGKPNLDAALKGIPEEAATILLAHNPDFAEEKPDPRVNLVLSGHTHGGQVYLPGVGTRWMPSRYGPKYRGGLAQAPASPVFVSRGLGEAGVPLRLNCPPEINLLTLVAAE
jgi:predicted MPP superfamily phosphohydrolase